MKRRDGDPGRGSTGLPRAGFGRVVLGATLALAGDAAREELTPEGGPAAAPPPQAAKTRRTAKLPEPRFAAAGDTAITPMALPVPAPVPSPGRSAKKPKPPRRAPTRSEVLPHALQDQTQITAPVAPAAEPDPAPAAVAAAVTAAVTAKANSADPAEPTRWAVSDPAPVSSPEQAVPAPPSPEPEPAADSAPVAAPAAVSIALPVPAFAPAPPDPPPTPAPAAAPRQAGVAGGRPADDAETAATAQASDFLLLWAEYLAPGAHHLFFGALPFAPASFKLVVRTRHPRDVFATYPAWPEGVPHAVTRPPERAAASSQPQAPPQPPSMLVLPPSLADEDNSSSSSSMSSVCSRHRMRMTVVHRRDPVRRNLFPHLVAAAAP